jgi:hypothetical protein
VQGIISHDTLSVAGLSVPNFQFGLITNQTAGFAYDPFDGIVGMAFPGALSVGTTTFINALNASGQIPQALFGLALSPEEVGGAEITLGDVDECKIVGDVNYIGVDSTQGLYIIPFEAVYANSQAASIPGGTAAVSTASSLSAIVDSGTANIVVPSAAEAESIYGLISPDIKPVDDRGTYGIECGKLEGLDAEIVFEIGGVNYTIPSRELSVGEIQGMEGVCQTLISAGGGYWIIGASLLKYYYSVWDVGGERLGLGRTAWSP